jgi:outer membrane biosynthesis protein TonB
MKTTTAQEQAALAELFAKGPPQLHECLDMDREPNLADFAHDADDAPPEIDDADTIPATLSGTIPDEEEDNEPEAPPAPAKKEEKKPKAEKQPKKKAPQPKDEEEETDNQEQDQQDNEDQEQTPPPQPKPKPDPAAAARWQAYACAALAAGCNTHEATERADLMAQAYAARFPTQE